MTAARSLLAGVTAIAALAGLSVVALFLLTGDAGPSAGRERRSAPAPAPIPPPLTGPGAAPPSAAPPAGLLGRGVPVEVERDPAPAPPPRGSWEAVPVAARAGALGPLGAAVGQELNELQPALAACFDEVSQASHGLQPVAAVRDAAPQDDAGLPVLMLQLEAGGSQVRIVDALVEARGGAGDGLLACAQRVLRGRTFPAPPGQAGRHRLLLTLAP